MTNEVTAHAHPTHSAKADLKKSLLTTKEVSTLTGFSTSYFEKGRINGYGPDFLRIRGRILYRLEAVENWLAAHECQPKGGADDR